MRFPFSRGVPFSLGELRAFEQELRAKRDSDKQFAAWLNAPSGADREWIKLRNDELVPIFMLGKHLNLTDDVYIQWQDQPDFVLTHAETVMRIEVTTTAPEWAEGIQHGHQRAIEGELSNQGVARIGHVFSRDQDVNDKVAMGRITVVNSGQRVSACEKGLASAIVRKSKQTFDSLDSMLLVYCSGFGMQTIDGEFPGIATRVAASMQRPPFEKVIAIHEINYPRQLRELGFQDMTPMAWAAS